MLAMRSKYSSVKYCAFWYRGFWNTFLHTTWLYSSQNVMNFAPLLISNERGSCVLSLLVSFQEQIRSKLPKYREPKQDRPPISAPQLFNTSGITAPPILRPGMPPPPSSVPIPMHANIIRPGMGPPMMDGRPPFQPPPVGHIPPPV